MSEDYRIDRIEASNGVYSIINGVTVKVDKETAKGIVKQDTKEAQERINGKKFLEYNVSWIADHNVQLIHRPINELKVRTVSLDKTPNPIDYHEYLKDHQEFLQTTPDFREVQKVFRNEFEHEGNLNGPELARVRGFFREDVQDNGNAIETDEEREGTISHHIERVLADRYYN